MVRVVIANLLRVLLLGRAQIRDIQASTSSLVRGSIAVRFSLPVEVIKMSSSILTPMPRKGSGTNSSSGLKYRPGSTVMIMPGCRTPSR